MEYYVDIAGTRYEMTDIQSVTIEQPLFDKVGVGNACSAELNISFWEKATVPRMAKIIPYARKTSADAWVKQGEFFTDTRSLQADLMTIVAYDAMLKAEIVWTPTRSLTFPMTMPDAVDEIISHMGIALDPRTQLNAAYTIDYPANEYTLRDVLRYIAAAHGGNWIITNEGLLLLVPLFASLPPETHYLVTETGDAITFGGVRILV